MINNENFYKCEKKLTIQDLEECEKKLSIILPDSLKELYLACNGGNVYKYICKIPNPPYQLKIANFIPIKYNKAFKNDPAFLLEGIALTQWQSKRFPQTLLPFARGTGSLFICIDIMTGSIYSYAKSKWDDTISTKQNYTNNTIYLFASLEDFLNALTSEEALADETQENSSEFIKPREGNICHNQEKEITISDVEQIEKELKIKMPSQLKDFILKCNGGMPENNAWLDPDDEYDYVAIHELIPIKYYNKFDNDKNYLMDGITKNLWNRKLLPETLLPFAKDAGGNYFCINLANDKIYYYTLDTWSDQLSLTDNYKQNTRFLCNSFNEFISGLVCEDDL